MKLRRSCWFGWTCIAINAALAANLYAVSLTRGPYIQMGHFTNQSTVVWRTDVSADSFVDYGLTASYGSTASGASGWQHEVTLTGLLPGTNYYYRVRSAGVNLASAQFMTGKMPGTPFRIATFSDAHEAGAGGVGARMALFKPDLILAAGDITDNATFAELDNNVFTKFTDALKWAPLYWSPGNHDAGDYGPCLEAFVLPGDEKSYWFEYADAQIVSLNAEGLPGTSWLATALASSTKPWKIVFFHEPAYSPPDGHGENATIRDQYVPVMEQYGVQLTVAGHNHYYWRSVPINGITHFQQSRSGNRSRDITSMPCYSAAGINGSLMKSFGVVDIDGPFMRVAGYDENGNLLDETVIDRECPFVMDGVLDASAVPVTSCAGAMNVWAAIQGRYLYVATYDAGEGNDNFVFLARNSTSTMSNLWSWSKSGTVMAYDAFLADENDNTYSGWFNAAGNAFGNLRVARSQTPWCNGGVLEGVIDLQALYGEIPTTLYFAAAPYATGNNGALIAGAQCPPGDGNGNIESSEFVAVNTASLITPFLMDGKADRDSYLIAESNGMKLWATVYGETLYVATWSPGNYPGDTGKNDHFIVVANQLAPVQPAFPSWLKTGTAAVNTNAPFLGGESINDYVGWQQTTATVHAAKSPTNAGQMEGTINLREAFGAVPATLYVAVAPYATSDGGTLYAPSQVPAGNGNANIESNEFLVVPVDVIRDDNLDGTFDSLDPTRGFVVRNIVPDVAGTTITWPSIPAHKYRVYSTDDLPGTFLPLSGELTAAQGQFSMSYTNSPPAATRFYRVHHVTP